MKPLVIGCIVVALAGCKKEEPPGNVEKQPSSDAPPVVEKAPAQAPPTKPPAGGDTVAPATLAPVSGTPELAEPMAKLRFMHGVWRGPAEGMDESGPFKSTQTERSGPLLGGDILVVEGRSFQEDGSTGFNAFAVISYDLQTQKYEMRSYTRGRSGTFELKLTDDGYVWEMPAGPGGVVRFTATVKDTKWREVGEYIAEGKPPMKTFEMNLERVADTDWPLGTPVSPTP